jgi:hypothetical protein
MNSKQKGFSVIHVLLLIIIAVIIGGTGWFVWNAQHATDKIYTDSTTDTPASKKTNQKEETTKKDNLLTLATNKVTLVLPQTWTSTQGKDQCRMAATVNHLICLEGATITPGEKLPTRYGNGTEFFDIRVSVYENPNHYSAKKWFEEGLDEGTVGSDTEESSAPINGYDAYFRQTQSDGDGTTIREINYSYAVGDKAVVLHARTYEPGELSDGTKVGDFRKFEPQIKEIADSIKLSF